MAACVSTGPIGAPATLPLPRRQTTRRRCLVLGLLAAFASPVATQGQDWSQWRGTRHGYSVAPRPLRPSLPPEGLRPLWINLDEQNQLKNAGWSSPIVAGDSVYLSTHTKRRRPSARLEASKYPYLPPEQRTGMSDPEYAEYERKRREEQESRSQSFVFEEHVICYDAETGVQRWSQTFPSVYTRFLQSSTPAVAEDRLLMHAAGRLARCLDRHTGKLLWETRLPGEFRDEFYPSSFCLWGKRAFVICNELFALDTERGEILWRSGPDTAGDSHSSPVVWETPQRTFVLANLNRNQTDCFDARTGQHCWEVPSGSGHSTPVIQGNLLLTYGPSRKSGLRCYELKAEGPELRWMFRSLSDPGSSPVVAADRCFVQGGRRLAAVDLSTGRSVWTTNLSIARPRYTSLIAIGEQVYYGYDGLLCFSSTASEFQPLYDAKIDATGLLAETRQFRAWLDMDNLERTAEGQREAEQIWRDKFDRAGPLPCSTPAASSGKLYVRLKNGIACYNLELPGTAE